MLESHAESPAIEAWLDIQHRGDFIEITPLSKSPKDIDVRYIVISTKTGKSGISSSHQEGNASLLPGQETALASLLLGFEEGDRYQLSLELYHQNHLIKSISTRFPD